MARHESFLRGQWHGETGRVWKGTVISLFQKTRPFSYSPHQPNHLFPIIPLSHSQNSRIVFLRILTIASPKIALHGPKRIKSGSASVLAPSVVYWPSYFSYSALCPDILGLGWRNYTCIISGVLDSRRFLYHDTSTWNWVSVRNSNSVYRWYREFWMGFCMSHGQMHCLECLSRNFGYGSLMCTQE